jgi:hypothetical protein
MPGADYAVQNLMPGAEYSLQNLIMPGSFLSRTKSSDVQVGEVISSSFSHDIGYLD